MTATANGERFMTSAHHRQIIHQLLTRPTLDSEMSGDDISHSVTGVANLPVSVRDLEAETENGDANKFSYGWRRPS